MGLNELFEESKKEKKISKKEQYLLALGFFGIGFINLIVSIFSDSTFSSDDKFAWIAMSGAMTLGGAVFFYYLIYMEKKRKKDILNSMFFSMLKEKKGKITLIDFAISANIEAGIARDFLEKKAIEFSAQPEITEDGEVVYIFVKTLNY